MAVPTVDEEYLKQIRKARSDLLDIIKANNCAPILLRLAFHDAGTYDPKTNSGGPNGSIRNEKELNHTANKGLEIAVDFCEQVKKNNPNITYADLYQLAGVVAVEATGGPCIEFVPGRKDSLESPEEGRLPSSKLGAQHLRDIFYRMGFTDRDIVALSGAHTLGSAHKDRSDYAGSWTRDPYKFDNSYFGELLKEETKDLLRLPTDKALLDDPSFKGFVELYAKDEAAFFKDYRKAHKKLSELGFIHQTAQNNTLLTQSIVIVAVATVLVVFSYFFEVQRRVR